jgi:hypothetical protein
MVSAAASDRAMVDELRLGVRIGGSILLAHRGTRLLLM